MAYYLQLVPHSDKSESLEIAKSYPHQIVIQKYTIPDRQIRKELDRHCSKVERHPNLFQTPDVVVSRLFFNRLCLTKIYQNGINTLKIDLIFEFHLI